MDRTTLIPTALAACGLLLQFGCGSDPLTYRKVDTPVGHATAYGAPRNTTYQVEAEAAGDRLRLVVREKSECERIRMRVVQRVVETVRDDEVVHRDPPQNVQIAEGSEGVVTCHERFVRRENVSLKVGQAVYPLGRPDKRGIVWVDLSQQLRQDLYGNAAIGPADATVLVEGTPAGTISLAALRQHGARVEELLAEFRSLLEQEQTELSPKDIARSYEIYAQLVQLAPDDARIQGLEARFFELVYGRKQWEANERLKRNLEALAKAKALLTTAEGAVPTYVQAAILDGDPTQPAIQWALRHATLSLRQHAGLCGGPQRSFTWGVLDSGGWPVQTRVALTFLRFAYNDPYADTLSGLCRRLY